MKLNDVSRDVWTDFKPLRQQTDASLTANQQRAPLMSDIITQRVAGRPETSITLPRPPTRRSITGSNILQNRGVWDVQSAPCSALIGSFPIRPFGSWIHHRVGSGSIQPTDRLQHLTG